MSKVKTKQITALTLVCGIFVVYNSDTNIQHATEVASTKEKQRLIEDVSNGGGVSVSGVVDRQSFIDFWTHKDTKKIATTHLI